MKHSLQLYSGHPAHSCPVGTQVMAVADGTVTAVHEDDLYGTMVEIDHGNQVITRYAHASKVLVRRGDLVRRGQKCAEVGTTGRSTGPHLHFAVWVQGVLQDPRKFLAAGDAATRTKGARAGPSLGTAAASAVARR